MPRARAAPRSADEPAAAEPRPIPLDPLVNICQLRVELPESAWVGRFSRENPDVLIEVFGRLDIGRTRSLTEIRLRSTEAAGWSQQLATLPQVFGVERLEGDPTAPRFRVLHRTSEFIPIFRELQLMRRFPFTIRAGEASWVVVATESKVRRLLARLREQGVRARLESVRHHEGDGAPGPLTARQSELLRRAMAAGYFEVPRKITLTDLAKALEMAPSSLSEALAIVEKKLLERWPSEPNR